MFSVLLIDDEVIIREGLRKMIPWEELGCEIVAEAEDGEQGLELIKEYVPDIIISDIRMPKKSGLEMIKEMRDINQDAQIIILTGFREFEYAQRAIQLGVLSLLLKPSKLTEIKASVEQAVKNLEIQYEKEEEYRKLKEKMKQYYLNETQGKIEENLEDRPQFIVNQAIEYIKEHYSEKLTLQTVADSLYVSTWHLCKVLKKETGTNFIDLLNEVRIKEAGNLLVTTNLRVYEIATKVGYTDTAYFSKMFKRITRLTPTEYRNTQYCTINSKIDLL